MLRRAVVMAFGFIVAAGCGAMFLPVAALVDPATRDAGAVAAMAGFFAFFNEAMDGGAPGATLAALGFALYAIVIAVCVAPLAAAALIGELAHVRSLAWYSGASGFLAAASPWIARAARGLDPARRANPLEARIALLFFLAGALTGAIYWLIAGRAPQARR